MKNNVAIFYGAIAAAIVGIALGVLYFIPHVYHPLVNANSHHKLAAGFLVLAVVGAVCAFMARPAGGLAR